MHHKYVYTDSCVCATGRTTGLTMSHEIKYICATGRTTGLTMSHQIKYICATGRTTGLTMDIVKRQYN